MVWGRQKKGERGNGDGAEVTEGREAQGEAMPELAPCEFVCGEADALLPTLLSTLERHVVFVYATA